MATGKKSFQLYTEWIELFEELDDKDAGQLIKHIFRYVNDKNPTTDTLLITVSFIQIKQQLKRDLKRWESKCEVNRANGALGGRPIKPKITERLISKPKKPDKVEVEDKEKEKEQLRSFLGFWNLYDKKIDKKKVEAKWSRLKESEKIILLGKLPAYIKSTPDIKYRKNPLTYLNGESWNDEIEFKPVIQGVTMGGSQNTADEAQIREEIADTERGYVRLKKEVASGARPKYESPIKKRLQSIKPK